MAKGAIDSVDSLLVDHLIADGRLSYRDLAQLVNLSPSSVRRRIDRLEQQGVITGYTVLVDESQLGETFEAIAEVRVAGATTVEQITNSAKGIPEVIAIYTVAGDPDAIVHFRIASLQHLYRLIDLIRRDGNVIGTKTLMVLDSWRRGEGCRLAASSTRSGMKVCKLPRCGCTPRFPRAHFGSSPRREGDGLGIPPSRRTAVMLRLCGGEGPREDWTRPTARGSIR